MCVRDFCRKTNELEDLGTDGKGIIFQWVFKEQADKAWGDLFGGCSCKVKRLHLFLGIIFHFTPVARRRFMLVHSKCLRFIGIGR